MHAPFSPHVIWQSYYCLLDDTICFAEMLLSDARSLFLRQIINCTEKDLDLKKQILKKQSYRKHVT